MSRKSISYFLSGFLFLIGCEEKREEEVSKTRPPLVENLTLADGKEHRVTVVGYMPDLVTLIRHGDGAVINLAPDKLSPSDRAKLESWEFHSPLNEEIEKERGFVTAKRAKNLPESPERALPVVAESRSVRFVRGMLEDRKMELSKMESTAGVPAARLDHLKRRISELEKELQEQLERETRQTHPRKF